MSPTHSAPRSPWTGRVIFVLLALLAFSCAVRAPFRSIIGEDEAFFALTALRWLHGLPPYAFSFDIKPPGLFAAFALAIAPGLDPMHAVKWLPTLCVGLTAFGLYLIGCRHLSARAGLWAALCYPVYTLSLSGTRAPTDLMLSMCETFGVLLLMESRAQTARGSARVAVAGLLFGLAFTIKQTAAMSALLLLAVLIWRSESPRTGRILAFGGGFMLPALAFALYFAFGGHFYPLLDGAWWGALARAPADGVSLAEGLWRVLALMKPLVLLLPGVVLLLTRWRVLCSGPTGPGVALLIGWLAADFLALVAMRALYPHYLQALIAPMLLAFWVALLHLPDLSRWTERRWVWSWLAMGLALPVAIDLGRDAPAFDETANRAVAGVIAREALPAEDTILVVNRGLAVYLLADRQPPGRYFHPQHLLCDFPAPDPNPLAGMLALQPRLLIVADTGRRMVCERADRHALLEAHLTRDYCRIADIEGRVDRFTVHRRRDAGEAACLE